MRILISGGSGSGKSEFAENIAMKLEGETRIYLATMKRYGAEAEKRIARHQAMRQKKGFQTIEQPNQIGNLTLPKNSILLLECLSNLLANEMFDGRRQEKESNPFLFEQILADLDDLYQQCNHLVIVTNEIFSDGIEYPKETMQYIKQLGKLNQSLGKQSDTVYEVVCGIPICQKGGSKCRL